MVPKVLKHPADDAGTDSEKENSPKDNIDDTIGGQGYRITRWHPLRRADDDIADGHIGNAMDSFFMHRPLEKE